MTQLVGRILRQPYARKFGVPALDESYVYYAKGETSELLAKIRNSFRDEGLEDLLQQSVKVDGAAAQLVTKTVQIRKEFAQDTTAFYLPIWMIVSDESERRFSYDLDIRPALNFADFALTADRLTKIENSLSEETLERQVVTVSLDAASHATFVAGDEAMANERTTSLTYLTRRVNEVAGNPFLARVLSDKLIGQLSTVLSADRVAQISVTSVSNFLGRLRKTMGSVRSYVQPISD